MNTGLARAAGLPVVVGDIDRGGVFASMFETPTMLEEDRVLVAGLVVNRFRVDRSLLEPDPETSWNLTGRPASEICGGHQVPAESVRDEVESNVGSVAESGLLPTTVGFAAAHGGEEDRTPWGSGGGARGHRRGVATAREGGSEGGLLHSTGGALRVVTGDARSRAPRDTRGVRPPGIGRS